MLNIPSIRISLLKGCISLAEKTTSKLGPLLRGVALAIVFVSVLGPVSAQAQDFTQNDNTGYYKLDNTLDSNSSTGVLGNFNTTNVPDFSLAGIIGNSAFFDGNDNARVGTTSLPVNTILMGGNWSVNFWIKSNVHASGQYYFDISGSGGGNNRRLIMYSNSSTWEIYAGTVETVSGHSTGVWYMTTIRCNNNTCEWWEDNVLKNTFVMTYGVGQDSLSLGNSADNLSTECNCYIDEFSYWKGYYLTDNDISYLYNSGIPNTAQQYPFSGGGPSPSPATSTQYVPASLFSSLPIIVDPVATTTYTFTAPATDISLKQGAVLMVSHLSASTPAVTWGGQLMINYITNTNAVSGYKTTLFYLKDPPNNSSVTISGIASSSINFISTSVWSNGDTVSGIDVLSSFSGTNQYIDLASLTASPIQIIGSMETQFYSSFDRLDDTVLIEYATSTSGLHFDFNRRLCNGYAGFTDCPLGYSPVPYSFPIGNHVAIGLYSTQVITASSSLYVQQYQTCSSLDIGCYISNAFQFLFVPSDDTLTRISSLSAVFASTSPFSYAYDMGNIRDELFNTSTTTEIDITVPFHYYGNNTAELTILSKDMLESVPYIDFVRTILSWLIWIFFAQFVYMQILKVHNKEHQ